MNRYRRREPGGQTRMSSLKLGMAGPESTSCGADLQCQQHECPAAHHAEMSSAEEAGGPSGKALVSA